MNLFIMLVLYFVHFEYCWYYFTRYQLPVKLKSDLKFSNTFIKNIQLILRLPVWSFGIK